MFSNQEMARPHLGHAEAGQTIDTSRGRRWMQTLRKLPIKAPKMAAKVIAKDSRNIEAQVLATRDQHGYLLTDIRRDHTGEVVDAIAEMPTTTRLRLL